MLIVLVVVLCVIGATAYTLFWINTPTLKEITERKYSFDELLDLINRAQIEEGREIKSKLYTHKEVLQIVDKAMDRIIKEKKQEKTTKKTIYISK